jgi:hypothetical protein
MMQLFNIGYVKHCADEIWKVADSPSSSNSLVRCLVISNNLYDMQPNTKTDSLCF